jgi:hypothetical protein
MRWAGGGAKSRNKPKISTRAVVGFKQEIDLHFTPPPLPFACVPVFSQHTGLL